MYCRTCYKEYSKGFKVKLIDHHGNEIYTDCCSKECCDHIKDKAIAELQKRIDLMRYQTYQESNY